MHISRDFLFYHYHRFNFFFQKCFPVLFLRSLDLFISYTMIVNFCQFLLTISCNLCIFFSIHVINEIWAIFNASVLKDIINVFPLYHTFNLNWSATGRRLVGDRSLTCRRPIASSRKEVPTKPPINRQPVPDQSQTSRRPNAKQRWSRIRWDSTSLRMIQRKTYDTIENIKTWTLIKSVTLLKEIKSASRI